MTDYRISSDWKVTHFKRNAVKKIVTLTTLFLTVKSSPPHSLINQIIGNSIQFNLFQPLIIIHDMGHVID
jgi:hypothetical protein